MNKRFRNLHDMEEHIRSRDLDITTLTKEVNKHFENSHSIRMLLIPDLNERYCAISQDHKYWFEMGESSPESRWYYQIHQDLEQFTEMLEDDNFSKDEEEFHQYMVSKAKSIYSMERSKYLFRAYKRALSSKLGMMDYNYTREEKDWL